MSAPSGWTVRPATRADLPLLGRLGGSLLRQHYAFDPQRFTAPGEGTEEGYAWFLGTQLEDAESVVLVAERDGVAAGYLFASLEPQNWKELRDAAGFIHDVVVSPDAQGSGAGVALMEAGCAWLKAHGAPRVLLWTAQPNAGAQRLFERLGFRRTMIEMTREL